MLRIHYPVSQDLYSKLLTFLDELLPDNLHPTTEADQIQQDPTRPYTTRQHNIVLQKNPTAVTIVKPVLRPNKQTSQNQTHITVQ